MVREDILGGLSLATEKGETLQHAMITFYGAGYLKKDIEEAAKVLLSGQAPEQPVAQPAPVQTPQKVSKPVTSLKPKAVPPKPLAGKPVQKVSSYGEQPKNITLPKPPQHVSNYGEDDKELKEGIDVAIKQLENLKEKTVNSKQKVSNYGEEASKSLPKK